MEAHARIRRTLGGPFSNRLEVPVTRELLERLGQCLVSQFVKEAKKDFAKRGWSGLASDGSKPIWESFGYRIVGARTVEVTSTFPFLEQMAAKGTQSHQMTWLTQEAKQRNPAQYPVTRRERRLGMKIAGRLDEGGRLPLVVPLKSDSGQVIFRTAPLTFRDAWVHPGIAKFTFVQRAARLGREHCIEILKGEVLKAVVQEMSE